MLPDGREEMIEVDDVLTREGYRLPLEAEWECAARSGTRTRWSCGDDVDLVSKYCHYNDVSPKAPSPLPVGSLKPNGFGLFDVHGNLHEWCHDRFTFDDRPELKPLAPANVRPARGGAHSVSASQCESSARFPSSDGAATSFVGFRPARTLP
jgi:formylglycine-generating enzyme required for sulfatase activity